jgi:Alcohol dehydrogenase GroES-like domain
MELLTEEESHLLMESMTDPFTRYIHDEKETARLLSSDQSVLLIHGPGEEYKLTENQCIPEQESDHEILIKVLAVGLNPIDWKGPDYNFGLPSLPWINGRDLAGVVVKAHRSLSRVRVGDVVLSPSTDYRDIQKAAFQESVISTEHNTARVPGGFPVQTSAAVGVAFVTAALALGVCCGVSFATSSVFPIGPDLFRVVRQVEPNAFATDIRDEVLSGVTQSERAKLGDWIAIWRGQ